MSLFGTSGFLGGGRGTCSLGMGRIGAGAACIAAAAAAAAVEPCEVGSLSSGTVMFRLDFESALLRHISCFGDSFFPRIGEDAIAGTTGAAGASFGCVFDAISGWPGIVRGGSDCSCVFVFSLSLAGDNSSSYGLLE